MRVIAHLNSDGSPCGRHLWKMFVISAAAATAAAATTAALGGTPSFWPLSCDEGGQRGWDYWADVAPPLHIDHDWFKGEGDAVPRCL